MKTIEYKVLYNSIVKDYIKENVSKKFLRHLKNMNVKYYLNDRLVKNYEEIYKDDILRIEYEEDNIKDNHLYDIPLNILYEDNHYMVLNKPSGLKTIPTGYNDFKSLYNAVLSYFIKNKIDGTIHFINRLDKDTEGLLIVAKDKYSAAILSKNLCNINKYYIAECSGIIKENGIIDAPIKKGDGIKRVVDSTGKKSITEYEVIRIKDNTTILKLKLLSGRCHQIRVHLSSIGHPIIGDSLYGSGTKLHLTSYILDFVDPFNESEMHLEIKPWFGE